MLPNGAIARTILVVGSLIMSRASGAELVDMVRRLNDYQYGLVSGNPSASEDIARQIESIERTIPTLSPQQLGSEPTAWAAATYLLCGGSTRAIHALSDEHAFAQNGEALILGSLAFADGRTSEAKGFLAPLNVTHFPPSLGSHLALVQGSLLMAIDKSKARNRLQFARLLAPDSLVEEAALRRELLTLDPLADFGEFIGVGRRYAERYAKSPFASRFWESVRAASTTNALNLEASQIEALDGLLQNLPSTQRLESNLDIAKEAILAARMDLARNEIEKAETDAQLPEQKHRIEFYRALLLAISGSADNRPAAVAPAIDAGLTAADRRLGATVAKALAELQSATRHQIMALDNGPGAISVETGSQVPLAPLNSAIADAFQKSDLLLQRTPSQ